MKRKTTHVFKGYVLVFVRCVNNSTCMCCNRFPSFLSGELRPSNKIKILKLPVSPPISRNTFVPPRGNFADLVYLKEH